ncbi:DUF3177 family protein [Alkalinema sp. FACHB-956]|uniref:DUF3177 family protein n=1 Tax=Alkalinema sp. FACHB-956 TaxID=2692768 RepID=UPI0016856367|nr:DUF3177 family protein [Alkalinema sp. FACHB-956]MBD2328793.1 DUF3177 family protein [Alkalinema sp. FACHB-956]
MAPWVTSLIWMDYRLAVLFAVVIPLVLLIGAFIQQADAIQRLMVIYWRVASLLLISTYLLIGVIPLGFISGWFARILIPISLWFWVDLNDEVRDQPNNVLKLGFTAWRWAVSVYCLVGAVLQLPVVQCAFMSSDAIVAGSVGQSLCLAWLQPPIAYKALLHPTTREWFLGILGLIGLGIYVVYLGYFIFFRLNKRKRSAIG